MSVSDSIISYIVDQLSLVGSVTPKRMFGGVGIFKEGKMFGMLNGNGTFFLKVNETNIGDYQEKGMLPFAHDKNKTGKMPYFVVPTEVIENKELMKEWAEKSIEIALNK